MAFGAILLASGAACAQETGLNAYNSFAAALKDLGVKVENGAVNYDATSDVLKISDSTVSLSGTIRNLPTEEIDVTGNDGQTDIEQAKLTDLTYLLSMASGTVTIVGLTHENDEYYAKSWTYSDDTRLVMNAKADGKGRIDSEVRIAGWALTNYSFSVPEIPAEDPVHQVSRWLPFVRTLAQASYDEVKADSTALTFEAYGEEDGNETLVASGTMQMDGYRMAGVENGKIADYSINRLTQSIRTLEPETGRMVDQVTSQGKTVYSDIDAAALIDLFDPAVPETGEKLTLLGSGSSIDYKSQQEVGPGLTVKMGIEKASISEVTGIKRDSDLLAMFDSLLNRKAPGPREIMFGILQFYRSFGITDARISGVSVSIPAPASGSDMTVAIEELAMTDVSSDGIGELLLVGLNAPTLPDGVSVKLDWAALGDITFAEFPPMRQMIGKLTANPDYGQSHPLEVARAFVPRSLGYEVEGLDVNVPDVGRTQIGKAEFNISTTVPPIPTSLYARNDGIRVPVETIEDLELKTLFQALGLDTVVWSDETRLYWDEATLDLRLERLMVDIEGLGRAEASARFANVPKALFEDPQGQGQIAAIMAQFVEASVTFKDAGLVSKGLPHMAYLQGVPEEALRSALVAQAVAASGQLKNQAFTAMVSEAATQFLNNPNGLKVTLTPANPVPLTNILGSLATAPQTLPDMLNVDVTAE